MKINRYVHARPGPGISVVYTDDAGNEWRFDKGSRTWRNQNPGNLVPGKVSRRHGAIGKAGGFAVFPSYEIGHEALLDSLKNVHGEKTIPSLMEVFAPEHENDTERYIAFLKRKTGVRGNRKIKDFSSEQFEKLWRGIEQMEGWRPGIISEFTPKGQIRAVRKDKKGTIQAYLIEGMGWVSKEEGIRLADDGKVDAVVAVSSWGNPFLRARPNREIVDNLENLG